MPFSAATAAMALAILSACSSLSMTHGPAIRKSGPVPTSTFSMEKLWLMEGSVRSESPCCARHADHCTQVGTLAQPESQQHLRNLLPQTDLGHGQPPLSRWRSNARNARAYTLWRLISHR